MLGSSLFVGLLADGSDPNRFAEDCVYGLEVVALIGLQILDTALSVLIVIPVDKAIHSSFHRRQNPEWPERITLASLLQAFNGISLERLLLEKLHYNLPPLVCWPEPRSDLAPDHIHPCLGAGRAWWSHYHRN